MSFFFSDWVPPWFQMIIIIAFLLICFCFILVPFSVFGLKSRLTYIEHQLEELQAQLRILLKRIPQEKNRFEVTSQETIKKSEADLPSSPHYKKRKPFDSYISPVLTKSKIGSTSMASAPTFDKELRYSSNEGKEGKFTTNVSSIETDLGQIDTKENNCSASVSYRQTYKDEHTIFNPPMVTPEKKHQDSSKIVKKRAEPILRWPPR